MLVWKTKKAYEQHKETEAYKPFQENLVSFSTTPPTTRVLELAPYGLYSKRCIYTGGWPSITITYFSSPLSDSQRTSIRRIRGLVPYCVYQDPPTLGQTRGFLQSDADNEVIPSSGAPAAVYVFIDWWQTPDNEEHVRNSKYYTSRGAWEPLSLETIMERELKEAGCVGKEVRHVRFNRVMISVAEKAVDGWSLEYAPKEMELPLM